MLLLIMLLFLLLLHLLLLLLLLSSNKQQKQQRHTVIELSRFHCHHGSCCIPHLPHLPRLHIKTNCKVDCCVKLVWQKHHHFWYIVPPTWSLGDLTTWQNFRLFLFVSPLICFARADFFASSSSP